MSTEKNDIKVQYLLIFSKMVLVGLVCFQKNNTVQEISCPVPNFAKSLGFFFNFKTIQEFPKWYWVVPSCPEFFKFFPNFSQIFPKFSQATRPEISRLVMVSEFGKSPSVPSSLSLVPTKTRPGMQTSKLFPCSAATLLNEKFNFLNYFN